MTEKKSEQLSKFFPLVIDWEKTTFPSVKLSFFAIHNDFPDFIMKVYRFVPTIALFTSQPR